MLQVVAKETDVPGFRKGSAPIDIARNTIAKEKVYDKLIQKLFSDAYKQILETDKLQPALSPQADLKRAQEGEDWELSLKIALQPEITLPDYKKIIANAQAEAKKDDIWVPGKSEEKPADIEAQTNARREKLLQKVLDELAKQTTIELSSVIKDYELQRRQTQLLDDVRKVGLSIDAYLNSKNLTQDELKKHFMDDIETTYKLEYALSEIADKENITVEPAEVDKLFAHIKDEAEKKEAQKNTYVYISMLRKQKVIDFLSSL
ncbi:MAG: Trigger factor [Microgenomates bacterium OLB23]|nr:MAG: Trigger factor [Microgenomates bacterium OLB23]